MSGLSSSQENLLMSNGFSINDMQQGVNNPVVFEGIKQYESWINIYL